MCLCLFYLCPSQAHGACFCMVALEKVVTQSGDRKIKETYAQSVMAGDTMTKANRKNLFYTSHSSHESKAC